jgi:ribosomal protein L35AE/L33A
MKIESKLGWMTRAQFVGYRRGLKSKQRNNQILIQIENVHSRDQASQYLGKQIRWTSPSKRKHKGRIVGFHGGNGTVKVLMKKVPPSLAIGALVNIDS